MTTENDTAKGAAPIGVPPVPPPPAGATTVGTTTVGTVSGPAAPAAAAEADGDGVRASAVKAARSALAAARDAAKRVQAAAGGDADAIEETTAANPPSVPVARTTPRPEMHYTAASGNVRLTPDQPGASVPPGAGSGGRAAGYGGVPGSGGPGQPPAEAARPGAPAGLGGGPRRVRLTVSRIDPWSVMKLAFLLAVAIGIMTVVATAVFWFVIDGLGVFATIQDFIGEAVGQQTDLDLTQFVAFDRVVSLATLIAVVNIVLLTAIATIMALLYNITAALVGGVHVTLTDD